MFDWISHNKELFLQSHTEIGVSYQHALDLQTQHNHFAMNSMVSWGHAVTSAGVRRGPAQEATCSAQGSMDLWEVMWGRSGWLWQQQCCSVHPDSALWLLPRLKSSTVLRSLSTFWRANTIFFKFLIFLWLGINASCRWHLNNLCFSLHTLLRYFSKPWKGDTNQAVSCGRSGILPFSVVNQSELLNANQFTFLF